MITECISNNTDPLTRTYQVLLQNPYKRIKDSRAN